MSCIFSIVGEHFDVDAFEEKCKLKFTKKSRKGEPRQPVLEDSPKMKWSLLSTSVSKDNFDSLNNQIDDVRAYITKNKKELEHIRHDKSIDFATFRFGLNFNQEDFEKSIYLPPDLIAMAGELGIGIEISFYNSLRFE